jgi:tripartite-type tricarboxylate transporter receptor subunit TctC
MMFDGLGSSAAHIKGGRIKALMMAGRQRNPAFPDVPCAGELGLPDYTVTTWYGLWTPKGTPPEVQARIVEEVRKAGLTDESRAVWAAQGAEFGTLSPAQFGSFVSAEVKRWEGVVKTSGAKLD